MTAGKILAWIASHLVVAGLACLVVWLALAKIHSDAEAKKALAAQQKAQDEFAREQGATKAQVESERQITAGLLKQNAQLAAFVAAMKKQNKGSTVAQASTGTGTITGTATGTLTPATPTAPAFCVDAFNRFKVNTKDCTFEQHQSFRVSAVTVRGVDGKSRFEKQQIQELDPTTGMAIGTGADLALQFAITEEKGAEPGPFHPRVVAAVNERGAFGAGVKFFSWKSVDASILGFYDRSDKSARGAIGLGYRLVLPFFSSTLSVGPHWFVSTNGKSGVGAAASIELTR